MADKSDRISETARFTFQIQDRGRPGRLCQKRIAGGTNAVPGSASRFAADSVDDLLLVRQILTLQHRGERQLPIPELEARPTNDPDGTVQSWTWDFGNPSDPGAHFDGAAVASYCYPQPGTYTITLTVTDNEGGTATATHQVQATDQPPQASP